MMNKYLYVVTLDDHGKNMLTAIPSSEGVDLLEIVSEFIKYSFTPKFRMCVFSFS